MVQSDDFIKACYNEFSSRMATKLSQFNEVISTLEIRKNKLYNLIVTNKYYIEQYVDFKLIENVNSTGEDYNKLVSIIKSIILYDKCKEDHRIYMIYVRSYLQLYKRLYTIREYLDAYYGGKTMPYSTFKILMEQYGSTISKLVLEGGEVSMGKIGSIYINPRKENFGKIKLKVDYKESFNTLLAKLETINPTLLEQYKSGDIFQKAIYNYAKENSIQYLVYHTKSIRYYWMWRKSCSRLFNYVMYSFTPTEHKNFKSNATEFILNELKTPENIIASNKLGNIPKLMLLVNYFPKLKSRFDNGLQTN